MDAEAREDEIEYHGRRVCEHTHLPIFEGILRGYEMRLESQVLTSQFQWRFINISETFVDRDVKSVHIESCDLLRPTHSS